MQTELYKVKYTITGFQYYTDCYGHYVKKDGSIIPLSVGRKSLCREEMEETPVYHEQESYVCIRSEDCINDIMECLTKYYSASILDCKVRFTSISKEFPVNFTIMDGEVVPQYS